MTGAFSDYPIQPRHLDVSKHPFHAFDHYETEISGKWLVRFAQKRGNWDSFTEAEILEFYNEKIPNESFWFNKLITEGYILESPKEVYHFTHKFISSYYKVRPATGQPSAA